jgi:hypothetical protein
MKKLLLIICLVILCGCSDVSIEYTYNQKIEPTEKVIISTPDPCMIDLKEEIEIYLDGDGDNRDRLFEIAKSCKDEDIYMRIQWGVRMKEPNILRWFLKQ